MAYSSSESIVRDLGVIKKDSSRECECLLSERAETQSEHEGMEWHTWAGSFFEPGAKNKYFKTRHAKAGDAMPG